MREEEVKEINEQFELKKILTKVDLMPLNGLLPDSTDEQLFPGGFWKSFGVNSAGLSVDAEEYNLVEGAGRIIEFLSMLRCDKDRTAKTLNGCFELDPDDILEM